VGTSQPFFLGANFHSSKNLEVFFFGCKFNDFFERKLPRLEKKISTKSLKISSLLHMVQVGG
jgi:hypothetical protein